MHRFTYLEDTVQLLPQCCLVTRRDVGLLNDVVNL